LNTYRSLAAIALVMSGAAQASTLCRWVDAAGRTQFAAVVPDAYKKGAICSDSQKYELPAAQRQAAEQRAADDRTRARQTAVTPATQGASGASGAKRPAPATSAARTKRPAERVTDTTPCPTWWRIYDESVECFGPYRTTRGATKPEAFEHCHVVPSPEARCGPRSH
jgi:hypothetical protein